MKTRFSIIVMFSLFFGFILKAEDEDNDYNIITNINYKLVDDYMEVSYKINPRYVTKPLKNVTLHFSKDGGDNFQKLTQVTGDVGTVSAGGTKVIKWYIFKELGNETISGNICFSITADNKRNIPAKKYSFIEYSGSITAPFGCTFGSVKKYGFYSRFLFSKIKTAKPPLSNEIYGDYSQYDHSRVSITVGPLFRIKNWLYLYTGIGYGNYGIIYEDNGSRYKTDIRILYNGAEFEAGGIIKIKWFTLSAGYTTLVSGKMPGFFGDILFGAGFMF